jgi:hypothetical protein
MKCTWLVPQRTDGPPSGASDSTRKQDCDLTSRTALLPEPYSQRPAPISKRDSSLIISEPLASYSTTQANYGSRFVSERTKTQCNFNYTGTASFSQTRASNRGQTAVRTLPGDRPTRHALPSMHDRLSALPLHLRSFYLPY